MNAGRSRAHVENGARAPTYRVSGTHPGRRNHAEEGDVKYMLLIYSNPVTWNSLSEAERTQMMSDVETIMKELTDTGEWVGGAALADPSHTRTIRVRAGAPAVTDGPYIEAKEHLAGYCVIECDTFARAADIAARWPDARYTGVELRPIMDSTGGLEM
jgi:hypothetical protein